MKPEPYKILIVDDSELNLARLKNVLNLDDYLIFTATDGRTALKTASLYPFDLMLLDVIMTGMDGFEVCRQIKEDPKLRDIPIINDATIEEARKSGIGKVARMVSSGCDAPGTILKRCSQEFLSLFAAADLIISKGQGNFESLSDEEGPIFFLLKVKCPVIARHLGAQTGGIILKDARLQKRSSSKHQGGQVE